MFKQNIKYFSLPANLRSGLTASQFNIIYLILDLCQIHSQNKPGGSVYVVPSEIYIAKKIGRSREWVSKSLQKLQQAGLIIITRRRKVRGRWMTNLYRLGLALWSCLKATSRCFSSLLHHVKSSSHIVLKPLIAKEEKALKDFPINQKSQELGELINRLTLKMGF
jgi:DNA-binding MarR family transcriptional regulator